MRVTTRNYLLAAALVAATSLHAQSWTSADPAYRAVPGPGMGASAGDIATDQAGGVLYSVGSAIVSDGTHMATVRGSGDSGQTWTTLNMYLEPGWTWAHYRGVTPAPDGSLYVSGELSNGSGRLWIVRHSTDQGFTWTTIDCPAFGQMGSCPSAGDVKVAPSGEVFACGTQGGGTTSPFQWVVRKGSGNPQTWTTIKVLGTAGASEARSIAFAGSAIFVAGRVADPKQGNSTAWTVQRSLDGGANWTTVDNYREGNSLASGAEGVSIDPVGKIYVTGYARGTVKNKNVDYWVVRRSTDGGATWVALEKLSNGNFLSPTSLDTDALGNIWVCGYAGPSSSPTQWLVRKGTAASNGTISWSTTDSFTNGRGARANGITVDAYGNVFATGRWIDSGDGENWWTTRKLSAH